MEIIYTKCPACGTDLEKTNCIVWEHLESVYCVELDQTLKFNELPTAIIGIPTLLETLGIEPRE